jgi:ligand-binding sensor domain-containing protein
LYAKIIRLCNKKERFTMVRMLYKVFIVSMCLTIVFSGISPSVVAYTEEHVLVPQTSAPSDIYAPPPVSHQLIQQAVTNQTFAYSLALDGIGDYVRVSHDDALNDYIHLTLEAWVRRASNDRCETVISKGQQSDYALGFCNRTLRFYLNGNVHESTTAIPANVWTHIAVVWKNYTTFPNLPRVEFYINGALDRTVITSGSPSKNSTALYIGANPDAAGSWAFSGHIAEVRLWGKIRTQDEIRRTMHVALEEPLPGLIANWHLSDDYQDNIGGHDGTPQGGADLGGPQAPPRPAVVPVDAYFNSLPTTRAEAATAYVSSYNRALLMGGASSPTVYAIDAATGDATALNALPSYLNHAAGAYAPIGRDGDSSGALAYVFGGQKSSTYPRESAEIHAIHPVTGYVRTLTATLPISTSEAVAVYHPERQAIYVIGGIYHATAFNYTVTKAIQVFDPISETLALLDIPLPQPRYNMAAAYAHTTGNLYVFGGQNRVGTPMDTIYELSWGADGPHVVTMTAHLPSPDYGLSAVEDSVSGLLYLLGGRNAASIIVFDPVTHELWETSIALETRYNASAIYSGQNRHALLIGGRNASAIPQNNIWRIPLGDGPPIPLGRWDFPSLDLPSNTYISAIDGDEDRVLVGTDAASGNADGAWRFDADGNALNYTAASMNSASGRVNDVRYDADNHWVWVATEDAGALLFDGSNDTLIPTRVYTSSVLDTDHILAVDVKPGATSINGAPFLGTFFEGLKRQYYRFYPLPGGWIWTTNFSGRNVKAVAHRAAGDLWVIADGWLQHLDYNTGNETHYGDKQCGEGNIGALAFGSDDAWWLTSTGEDEFSYGGVCYIPAAATPGDDGQFWNPRPPIGYKAMDVDVDADGRVWVAFSVPDFSNGNSGGLVAWETANSPRTRVRTEEYTWENAPLGGNISDTTALTNVWASGLTAVGAVDERVWGGTEYRGLATIAQRWQQLDESNGLDQKAIESVWAVRGRLFLAGTDDLYILRPDGKSWDHRAGVHAHAVMQDSQGRIWVGTDDDVRHYTTTGWDILSRTVGTPPTTTVHALAEDQDGRIWLGGAGGLTLFDRERFVATFTAENSALPTDTVQALLVDGGNRLWVGTTYGLLRIDSDDSAWMVYTTTHGLPSDAIYDLAQLDDGQIAISTDAGLSLYDGTGFTVETLPIDATNLPLTVDETGRLWAGSAVRTADRWQGYYWTNSGLRHTTISDNAADGADRVWFSHAPETGISVRGAYLPPLANTVPLIDHIEPRYGTAGDTIRIVGSGFGDNPSDVVVTIGGAAAEVVRVTDDTTVTVRLTDQNISGDVSVSVDGRRVTRHSSSAPIFCAVPQIHEISPTGGNAGVMIHIRGSNFDYNPQVYIGGAGPHYVVRRRATHLELILQTDDGNGVVQVQNACHNAPDPAADTSAVEVHHIPLSLADVALNQGVESYGLVPNKPTLIQHYLTCSGGRRATDVLEIDEVEVTFGSDVDSPTYAIPYNRGVPVWLSFSEALQQDIQNTLNVFMTPYIDSGSLEVHTVLKRRGLIVTERTQSAEFRPEYPINVLLVPIMQRGYTESDLHAMEALVNSGLDEARRRMPIIGRMSFIWSPMVLTSDDNIDLGDVLELYSKSHDMDRARRRWNNNHATDALFAFGVVDPRIVTGGTTGYGFWPDISELLNTLLLDWLDALCDIANALLQIFSFGLLGSDDGCHLEIPLYVGWAIGGPRDESEAAYRDGVSSLFVHEFGHIMGLVKGWAPNHGTLNPLNDDYNISHSKYDELNNGSCGGSSDSDYTVGKTFYRSPAVWDPVVNPLTQQQLYPRLEVMSGTSRANTDRAKSMMSYACSRSNDNTFFEPVDLRGIFATFGAVSFLDFVSDLIPGGDRVTIARPERGTDTGPTPIPIAGQRLYVSGIVTKTDDTGVLHRVEVLGEEAPLSAGFATGYWLVQLDESGEELLSTGIYPLFTSVAANGDGTEHDAGFFAATLLGREDVQRIELRHDTTVLDTFTAGSTPPTVTVTHPISDVYGSGTISVTWSASDADGDEVTILIDYTPDGGATWTTVAASSEASGTVAIPLYQLSGSDSAHFRVTATDGFNSGSATSEVFTVADQPPRPYIGQPAAGASFLEGQRIMLIGGADDNQDGTVANNNLQWRSDQDGDLGNGSGIGAFLSVGQHTLTLEAENSVGLTATTSITMTVEGDYDYDGIPDTEESTLELNPLTEADAYADADGDGLPLGTERNYGTNPKLMDTDGDGRDDAEEIVAGTDPTIADSPLPTDTLSAYPDHLTFEVNLALDTPLPQQPLQIVSRGSADWTLTADVPWLAASDATGTTPAVTTIMVQVYDLTEGVHTGVLTFTSTSLTSTVTVPVTATITNSAGHFDANRDTCVNVGDIQAITFRIPSDNSQEDFSYHYDIDRDGDVDANDATTAARQWSATRGVCGATYADTTSVMRVSAPASVTVGDSFTSSISLSAVQNLAGFEFDLTFDPAVLQVRSAVLGDLLGSTGRLTATLGPIVENTTGTLAFGGYTSDGASGVSGDGILAHIGFHAVSTGTSSLDLGTPLLATPSGTLTMASDQDTEIQVVPLKVCTPLTDVVIHGPSQGITNTTYTFTATISPEDTSPPIIYTWSPRPQSGQETPISVYTWSTTGTQRIQITAENCGGLDSATHEINISALEEVSALYLPLVLRNVPD